MRTDTNSSSQTAQQILAQALGLTLPTPAPTPEPAPVAPDTAPAAAAPGQQAPPTSRNTPDLILVPEADDASPSTGNELSDRRRHRRFEVTRPGKVFRRQTQEYQAAESCDLSFAGALLSVRTARPIAIGEIVDVALALTKSAVVPSASMLQGVVVRTGPIEQGRQQVAVRYITPSRLAQAA